MPTALVVLLAVVVAYVAFKIIQALVWTKQSKRAEEVLRKIHYKEEEYKIKKGIYFPPGRNLTVKAGDTIKELGIKIPSNLPHIFEIDPCGEHSLATATRYKEIGGELGYIEEQQESLSIDSSGKIKRIWGAI